MKQSIAYLPKRKQDDLHYLVKTILDMMPQTQMIILYGSYARGDYVEYDRRVEFGIPTSFMSDYDILVVTHGIKDRDAGQKLYAVEQKYHTGSDSQTPVQFINDDIEKVNSDLSEGRYFYTQVKKEGVVLYDSKKFKLARSRKLKFDEIKQQAQEYFKEKNERAESFLRSAKHDYKDKEYRMCSFHLHQTCENSFYATRLTFALENDKQHNLAKLLKAVKKYSDEFIKIFPYKTAEEKRLFDLLKAAYVQARYNPKFLVTKADIDALMPIVKQLLELVKRICKERIREYGGME